MPFRVFEVQGFGLGLLEVRGSGFWVRGFGSGFRSSGFWRFGVFEVRGSGLGVSLLWVSRVRGYGFVVSWFGVFEVRCFVRFEDWGLRFRVF